MFRIKATVRAWEPRYAIEIHIRRDGVDRICGLVNLRSDEWPEFLKLCEAREIDDEAIPTQSTEARDAG